MLGMSGVIVFGAALVLTDAPPEGGGQAAQTGSCLVSGTPADGVTAFLGIPFAALPVGQLRWRPLQWASHWEGLLQSHRWEPHWHRC